VADLISKLFLTENEQTPFVNRKADERLIKLELKRTVSRDLSENQILLQITKRREPSPKAVQYFIFYLTTLTVWHHFPSFFFNK